MKIYYQKCISCFKRFSNINNKWKTRGKRIYFRKIHNDKLIREYVKETLLIVSNVFKGIYRDKRGIKEIIKAKRGNKGKRGKKHTRPDDPIKNKDNGPSGSGDYVAVCANKSCERAQRS